MSAGLHGPTARACGHNLTTVLVEVGDVAAAERTCAAGLAGARAAGDLWSLGNLLEKMVVLDLASGRYADDALHLREALQTALRTGVRRKVLENLDCCGYLCARTGRSAEAVTVWAAVVAPEREGFSAPLHPDLPEGWPGSDTAGPNDGERVTFTSAGQTLADGCSRRRSGPGPRRRWPSSARRPT